MFFNVKCYDTLNTHAQMHFSLSKNMIDVEVLHMTVYSVIWRIRSHFDYTCTCTMYIVPTMYCKLHYKVKRNKTMVVHVHDLAVYNKLTTCNCSPRCFVSYISVHWLQRNTAVWDSWTEGEVPAQISCWGTYRCLLFDRAI